MASQKDWVPNAAAEEASAYFNSLPIEQRRRLAPLLEEHRRLGMVEYAEAIGKTTRAMRARLQSIQDGQENAREARR